MKSRTKLYSLLVVLTVFGACLALAPMAISHDDQDQNLESVTVLYEDITGDGDFTPVASYLVDPYVALQAYNMDPASAIGDQHVFSVKETIATRIGSGDGFQAFLEANYQMLPIDKHAPDCDATVNLTYTLTCWPTCTPDSICTDQVIFVPVVGCLDNPPCPENHFCEDYPGRITSITLNQQACDCEGDPLECLFQAGTLVTAFTASAAVCACAHLAGSHIPTTTNLGLLILVGLLLMSGLYVIYRRRQGVMDVQ